MPTSFTNWNFTRFRCILPEHWWCPESNQSPDAQSGEIWLVWVQSISIWWWRDFNMERKRSPDSQIQVFGLDVGDCDSSIYWHRIHAMSGANSDDWRVHCVTPQLIRIHALVTILEWIDIDRSIRWRPKRDFVCSRDASYRPGPFNRSWFDKFFAIRSSASSTDITNQFRSEELINIDCFRKTPASSEAITTRSCCVRSGGFFHLLCLWFKEHMVKHGANRRIAAEQTVVHNKSSVRPCDCYTCRFWNAFQVSISSLSISLFAICLSTWTQDVSWWFFFCNQGSEFVSFTSSKLSSRSWLVECPWMFRSCFARCRDTFLAPPCVWIRWRCWTCSRRWSCVANSQKRARSPTWILATCSGFAMKCLQDLRAIELKSDPRQCRSCSCTCHCTWRLLPSVPNVLKHRLDPILLDLCKRLSLGRHALLLWACSQSAPRAIDFLLHSPSGRPSPSP